MSKPTIKCHFEANMLDGDDVYDCGKAVLSAEDVYEYIKKYYELKEKIEQCK
jgi:hypothetical protein